MIRRMLAWLRNSFALVVIVVAFLWSIWTIQTARREEAPPGTKIVLRIGHWQLETGVRDALNKLAAEYHTLHPDVMVVQDPIPESTYGTWLTTQLMGGTAPDMLEPGMVWPEILIGYYSRYFRPMTPSSLDRPNPYNAKTPLAGVAWRKTFRDGLRSGYIDALQEYYTVPLSQANIRLFYNKTLFKKLTGLPADATNEPPKELRAFLAVCDRIKQQQNARGQSYIPLAGSGYHFGNMWDPRVALPLTYGILRKLDFNRDSTVSLDEFYVGMETGRIRFDLPEFAARFKMIQLLVSEFQTGWTGLGRDEAVFLFAQQRAVFIPTGTWDFRGLQEQAKDEFDVGVIDFPHPTKTDPDFGTMVEGPVYESSIASFAFAITRTCKYPEVALDFLQFLSSQQGNEELNKITGWIPSVNGANVSADLKEFEPHLEGVYGAMPVSMGGDTVNKWNQITALFNIGQIDYPALTSEYRAYYLQHAPDEFAEFKRNVQRGLAGDEQFLAGVRARALTATNDNARLWVNYRNMATSRLLLRDLNMALINELLAEGPVTNAITPYEVRPAALAKVRARLAGLQGGN